MASLPRFSNGPPSLPDANRATSLLETPRHPTPFTYGLRLVLEGIHNTHSSIRTRRLTSECSYAYPRFFKTPSTGADAPPRCAGLLTGWSFSRVARTPMLRTAEEYDRLAAPTPLPLAKG